MEGGLRSRATGVNGETIVTDMPKAIGGGGEPPFATSLATGSLGSELPLTVIVKRMTRIQRPNGR